MAGGQQAFLTRLVIEHLQQQMKIQGEFLQRDMNEGYSLFPSFPLLKPSGDLIVTLSELLFGVEIISKTMSKQPWLMRPWVWVPNTIV